MKSNAFSIPDIAHPFVERKYGNPENLGADAPYKITLYILFLCSIVFEGVSPARGHKARRKRLYDVRDKRHFAAARKWSAAHGFDYDHYNLITGAWEVREGITEGYFTDIFYAKLEPFQQFLLEMADTAICPFDETPLLLDMAAENWTLMDAFDIACADCCRQIGV